MNNISLRKIDESNFLDCFHLKLAPGQETYVCRTLFSKTGKDYTVGQPKYTLLQKEKCNLITGETIIQYDRLFMKNQAET